MDFFSDQMRRDPYQVYARMRAESPVMFEPQSQAWMVFSYEGVKRVLSDHESFSSDTAGGGLPAKWFIFMDPPRHSQLRALVMQAFSAASISGLEPKIRQFAHELLSEWTSREYLDLTLDFANLLPMRVIAELMGVPEANFKRIRRWVDATLDLSYVVSHHERAAQALEEFGSVSEEMNDYLSDQLSLRRQIPKDDLLGRLINAEVDGERLDQDAILGFFQLLLLTGSETTANLIGNSVLCLMANPEQWRLLREQPELLPGAIEEVIRYRSPVQAMFRLSRRDVELHGQVIPAGSLVLPFIGSANHDPQHFSAPERFDITRKQSHIGFGHGIHACIGAQLARLEGRIALQAILENFDELSPVDNKLWEPRKAFHVHGPRALPLKFRARSQV